MAFINSKKEAGFSMIEILISIGILMLLAGIGLFISMNFFRNFSSRSEESDIIGALEKARGESMNNIDQTRHGVHFDSPLRYIVFQCQASSPKCSDYTARDASKDLVINPEYKITITGIPFDVVFDQLTGCLTSGAASCAAIDFTIHLTDQGITKNIVINKEGRIDWQ